MEFITTEKRIDKKGNSYYYESWDDMTDGVNTVIYSGICKKEDYELRREKSVNNPSCLVDYTEYKDGSTVLIIIN